MEVLHQVLKSIVLSVCCLTAPFQDTYVIEIPKSVDLNETSAFEVRIKENGLSENQILHIDMPSDFFLYESDGQQSVQGSVSNNSLSYRKDEYDTKTVGLEIGELAIGEWSGTLPISISIENTIPSNILECGEELNAFLQLYDPARILFTDAVEGTYIGDVSKAKDESVKAYLNEDTIFISNESEGKILSDISMKDAFRGLSSLTYIDLSDLELGQCITFSHMFADSPVLSTIQGIGQIDTSSAQDLSHMFSGCRLLTSLKISDWNTGNVTDFSHLFEYCEGLKTLNLLNWDVKNGVGFQNMFAQCLSLTSTGDLSSWDMNKAEDISKMFYSCQKLRNTGDLSNWSTGTISDMSYLFAGCSRLTSVGPISVWDVSNVINLSGVFANASSLANTGDLNNWQISPDCKDLSYLFAGTKSLLGSDPDLSSWNVSAVENMPHMFENCKLTTLNIEGWDTSCLKDASYMFAYNETTSLSELTDIIGIEDLNTSALETISSIFYENQYLNADLSAWNTSVLQDISYAFYGTYRFDIDKLKHWNVSSVLDMTQAFGDNAGTLIQSPVPDWYQ